MHGTFNGLGHKITGIRYNSNNRSIFGYVQYSTIKNLAVVCTMTGLRQGALYYNGLDVSIDNVYIDATFAETASCCGGICDVGFGSLTVSNSLILTKGFETQSVAETCGAMIARDSASVKLKNTYMISDGKICSEIVDGANKNSTTRNATKDVLFENESNFVAAIQKGTVSFEGYNYFWNLSGEMPGFKSLT